MPSPVGRAHARRAGRTECIQALLDHAQREEVVALLEEDPPQALKVGRVEASIARRCAFGIDEALALKEANLRDGDIGELAAELVEYLPDGQVDVGGGFGAHAVPSALPTTNVSTNRPTCTSFMSVSVTVSIRS